MILVIDIGNTNTVFCVFDGEKKVFESRMDTNQNRMADQYAVLLNQLFQLYGVEMKSIDGCAISSVVPPVSDQLKISVSKIFGTTPLVIGSGIKTGLNILIDDPSTLGADLACGAAAAKELYPLPCVVLDLGTATKVYALDKNGAYIGGVIAPGIKISLDALADKTVFLPMISLEGNCPVIGRNTVDAMRSGILYGHGGMLDGFINRFRKELGECSVVATGGLSEVVKDYCENKFEINHELVMQGLRIIYEKNKAKR